MGAYSSTDFLTLDETQFSEAERLIRDSARDSVYKEFMPRAQEHVRLDGSFPMELMPQMAELGMFVHPVHRLL